MPRVISDDLSREFDELVEGMNFDHKFDIDWFDNTMGKWTTAYIEPMSGEQLTFDFWKDPNVPF